jgi:indole-3-glycerol phosphate synthase
MTDFLERVVAERRADVAQLRASADLDGLHARADAWPRERARAFFRRSQSSSFGLSVIAEVKRVSPAAGVLNAEVDPARQAAGYAAAGAAAISVLTEPRHWHGGLGDLAAVRRAVELPLLAKDIVVDELQILEARAFGADLVLLIAEALDDATLRRFVELARRLGMEALVEAHEPAAFGRAVRCGARFVGVNARDLRRPSALDPGRVRQLHTFALAGQVLVAESGIASVDDARLLPARVDAVLVGTSLMRADDPAPLIRGISSLKRTVTV